MNELNKSLSELELAADELLQKSSAKEEIKKIEDKANNEDSEDELEKCDPNGDNLKKSDDSNENNKENTDTESNENDDEEEIEDEEDTEKSLDDIQEDLTESFKDDVDIAAGIRNSEFQAALVCQLVKALGDIQYDFMKSNKSKSSIDSVLIKSFQSVIAANNSLRADNDRLTRRINALEKSMNKGFDHILDTLDSMSNQPAHMRKSVGNINIHDKNFQQSIGNVNEQPLSKAQVLDILSNELYSGNNKVVTVSDIVSYESGAPLRPEVKAFVESKRK